MKMEEKKILKILETMEGITYLEWMKLRMCIDNYYQSESSKQNNKIPLTGSDLIVKEYKYYSSTI